MPEKPGSKRRIQRYERNTSSPKGVGRSKKGKSFSKKSSGILCEGDRLAAYRFIEQYHKEFGTRWLLKRLGIYPNAYYNYLKHRKETYYSRKAEVKAEIKEIYHNHQGVCGYRSMRIYLLRKGYAYSAATVHKYMNTEMKLYSIVRPKRTVTLQPTWQYAPFRKPWILSQSSRANLFYIPTVERNIHPRHL